MKVAYIFGKKDKDVFNSDLYGNDQLKDKYSFLEERTGFQKSFEQPKQIVYRKMLLKLNDEYKFFYVLEGHSKEVLKSVIAEYWHLSDIAGFDLN